MKNTNEHKLLATYCMWAWMEQHCEKYKCDVVDLKAMYPLIDKIGNPGNVSCYICNYCEHRGCAKCAMYKKWPTMNGNVCDCCETDDFDSIYYTIKETQARFRKKEIGDIAAAIWKQYKKLGG